MARSDRHVVVFAEIDDDGGAIFERMSGGA
jgi:hypothetical protein